MSPFAAPVGDTLESKLHAAPWRRIDAVAHHHPAGDELSRPAGNGTG